MARQSKKMPQFWFTTEYTGHVFRIFTCVCGKGWETSSKKMLTTQQSYRRYCIDTIVFHGEMIVLKYKAMIGSRESAT